MCSMTIRSSIYFILCFTVLFGTALGLYVTSPHIIVFMADDLGWDDVGFHGSDQIPTPNIDALAYNGIILNRHYVLPSSTPSRTAFFTGQYPIRLGMQGADIQGGEPRGIPLNVKILPEYLRGLGYMTKLIGKWHVGYYTSQHTPLNRGFDSFFGFYNSHITYYDYKYSFQNMSGYDMHRGDAPAYVSTNKYVTDLFTDEAVRIIQYHEPSQPLFLQISHLAVHAPLESPHDYDYYDRQFRHIREINRRKYAGMVSRLDNSVGRVVQALGSRGMLKDSLILFLTDNGAASIGKFRNYGSNYPLRGMKYTLYEGGVRGVAVLWSPRLRKTARVCDDLMHITDWLPTLYTIAGGDVRDLGEIDGVNQWCMLNDSLPSARDRLLLNIDEVSKTEGAIYKQFKLLRGSIEGGYYDGYYRDIERIMPNDPRKSLQEEAYKNMPPYTDTILKSVVSESITRHLGDPVTQPSTIIQLRREATVNCRPRDSFITCNVTECLFDINNDPCETRNIAEQYSRISRELDKFLEHYGLIIKRQIKIPVDWLADPRRTNNTWEPWGWNDVSFHGADEIPTPNIDALAYNGVILNRHYVLPICTPSRTAFLTGKYPIRTGMQGFPLRGAEPRGIPLNNILLPEYLRKIGYATHLVGKWHVGYYTKNYGPTRRGFDTFLGYYSGYIEYFNHSLYESEQLGYDLHRIVGDNHKIEYSYDYMTDLITDEAENIISSHNPAKPLYLQLAHLAPHSSGVEDAMQVRNWTETNITLGYIEDINRRKYASVVATLDESVGRVIDALKRTDMLKNSIIIFIADNGAQTEGPMQNYGSNYPLRGLKFSLFEGSIRGTACIYSPLIDHPSRVSTQLFHITDWLPTLYSAAGGNPNDLKQLDGIDQWSVIKNARDGKRKSILMNIDEKINSEAALIGSYKLVKDKSEYQKYYNYNGKNILYPKYNAMNVLTSPAASAIASVSTFVLNANKVMQLREEAAVVCKNFTDFPNCTNRICLFNVYEDPCETTDLSSKYPKDVERLNMFIDRYKSVLMNQTNAPVDPAGFPSNFNDTWVPWLPDDYQSISEMHFTMNEVTP